MKINLTILIITALLVCQFSVTTFAQTTRQMEREKPNTVAAEKRVALVIGNGDYVNARKLVNPVNDANDMTQTLRDVGFEVVSGTNLSLKQMTDKVREFGDKLNASGGVGLFYYAGHGVQLNNKNYLIPVEADITREDEIDFSALNFDQVLRKMATANNGLNIVILDACRNNPFARSWSRGEDEGGLAQISAPTGTFIAYATSPDKTASDGTGRNGLYTAELLKFIKQPNLTIEETFKEVRKAVKKASGDKQIPWDSSSLSGDFYFNSAESNAAINPIPKDNTEPTKVSGNTTSNRTAGAITRTTLPGGIEMSFAYIPAGSFERSVFKWRNLTTGATEWSGHTVKISQGFQMQTTEVTQSQWKAVMGAFPSKCDSGELKGKFLGDNKPIICVSWDNAQEFVRQMNLKNDGYKYRLPTEAEWEYAARAGTTGDFAGDLDSMAWYYNNSGDQIINGEWNESKMKSNNNRMHDVATKKANAWGLYDMHGNVWEWCQDWFGDYTSEKVTDPTGPPSGKYRVLRGGGWSLTAESLRLGIRFPSKPSQRHAYNGFRIVRQ